MNQTLGTIGGLARVATLCLLTAAPVAWAQQPGPGTATPGAERPKTKPKADAKQADQPKPKARRDRPGFYMGRRIADVMSWQGAEWLYRETRIEEEQPEAMLDALEIAPGSTVADVGTGAGYHSIRLARRVGDGGAVLATDVQPEMLDLLRENARTAGIENIKPLLATQRDTKLPAGKVDLILMVDVYHEVSSPEVLLAGLHKALRPGGRLVLVEFRGEDPEVPIKPEHKMTLKQVRREVEPQGFRFQRSLEFLPWQHVIIFEKPKPDEKAEASAEALKPEPAKP
ncbi:MAG: class I SAM-dependent methyltransferase [Paludisphaera borealis]|uniref:class I SAM-dependent methyltransferase n=1 Tax=Paludisphaera borealis TaxID=1387353 RepID=UPI00284C71B5|nr:class I SAM-dependent methyltransferase [Paludisphaera borealis]MDR3617955.1 class I SAM-dependent methyltransferase [Paludisphaera borealis]